MLGAARRRAPPLLGLLALLALAGCDRDRNPTGPARPAELRVLGLGEVTERYTAEVDVRGDHAYTTTWGHRSAPGNALKIWNVAGNQPVLLDSVIVSGAHTLGDVQVSDDGSLLVVATEHEPGSIVIFDLADPARPAQIARFESASTWPGVHTAQLARVDGRLYAFLSVDPSPARLVIVDLSDPAHPVEVLSREMGQPFVHDVFVRDGLLFTALWDAGMTIWDIGGGGRGGSVANPVPISNVQTVGGSVHNLWWLHDPVTGLRRYVLVGEESGGGSFTSSAGDIHVVDISDIDNPREVAFFTISGAGTHNFSVDEERGILYAAYYNAGVQAFDIRGDLGSCPAAARVGTRCDLTRAGRRLAQGPLRSGAVYVWGVRLAGGAVYASDMLRGLWKLEAIGM